MALTGPPFRGGRALWERRLHRIYVLKVRVRKDKKHQRFHAGKYEKAEELFFAEDVQVTGMWIFPDADAFQGDSRIFEWDPKFETIPQSVVDFWHSTGTPVETTTPNIITDPDPKFMPMSWATTREAIQTTDSLACGCFQTCSCKRARGSHS